jgi:hypothetical protein
MSAEQTARMAMMLRYVAEVSVGPSTTQSYKREGAFRYGDFLRSRNLTSLFDKTEAEFTAWLNMQSTRLSKHIVATKDPSVSTWGMARKILNIFLHNVYFNNVLHQGYQLERIEPYFEVPLDSDVVAWLLRVADETQIEFENPITGKFAVYKVTKTANESFQRLATKVARKFRTSRVYLDTYFYRTDSFLWIYDD